MNDTVSRILCSTAVVACAAALPGCVIGSLATNTGPSDIGTWSTAAVQQAHVGERVGFSFILREPGAPQAVSASGLADYVVVHFGGERAEFNLGLAGRFEFEHAFTAVQPGERMLIRAEALKIRAGRDTMQVAGEWKHTESPFNEPDREMARDELTLEFYQSRVEISVAPPPDALDWQTARLDIVRRADDRSAVYRRTPSRHGFSVSGPGADGRVTVTYAPTAEQVNRHGTTAARLTVLDSRGQTHEYAATFETP